MSMLDWAGYRKQLAATIGEIAKAAPDLFMGCRTLVAARSTSGATAAPSAAAAEHLAVERWENEGGRHLASRSAPWAPETHGTFASRRAEARGLPAAATHPRSRSTP